MIELTDKMNEELKKLKLNDLFDQQFMYKDLKEDILCAMNLDLVDFVLLYDRETDNSKFIVYDIGYASEEEVLYVTDEIEYLCQYYNFDYDLILHYMNEHKIMKLKNSELDTKEAREFQLALMKLFFIFELTRFAHFVLNDFKDIDGQKRYCYEHNYRYCKKANSFALDIYTRESNYFAIYLAQIYPPAF